ncbi:hypothetical protein D3C76_1211440 [compost metagenome]
MQHVLDMLAERLVFARDHRGGQCMFGDFTGQVRPGQHTDACLWRDLFENLAHQLEGVGFDALGQAHQHFAAESISMRGQHRAQRAGGQRDKTQVARIQGGQQVSDRRDTGQDLDAFEVTRVLAIDPDGLGLFGVTHPLQDLMTIFGQQVSHGGTKTSASQNRDRALLSHM